MSDQANIKDTLQKLLAREKLSKSEAKSVLSSIGKGRVNEYQITALLTAFQMRQITGVELAGFREAMIDLAIHIDLSDYDTIDLCGTGGDGKNTFNISTLASLVVAGAGYKVAKHGNSGKSSVCGSSNVLEYLGYEMSNDKGKLKKEIEENNFCYMHAPLFHPAMKEVGAIRKGLGFGTFFNMLGPLLNPSKPKRQIAGVYSAAIMPLYKAVFEDMGSDYAVIHSRDGYDEISLTSPFLIYSNSFDGEVQIKDIGLKEIKPQEIYGGDTIDQAVNTFVKILEGKGSDDQTKVVCVNAGYAIQRFKPDVDIKDCISEAVDSIESGKAFGTLKYFMAK